MTALKKLAAAFMALLIAVSLLPPPAAYAASDHAQIVRMGGKNRYDTASVIADKAFDGADTVILASGENFADALAAAPLGHCINAPILLTGKASLSKETASRLAELNCRQVLIMGGTGAVSAEVEDELISLGYGVERISGRTRYETAVQVAVKLHELGSSNTHEVFIACGTNYPDALSASPVAALRGSPILYSPVSGELDEATMDYLTRYNIQRAYILGGTGAVGDAATDRLDSCGVELVSRLKGKNRYDTSLEIAKHFLDTFTSGNAAFATGKNFPDALAGSVFAAAKGVPVLLTDNKTIHTGIKEFLAERDPAIAYAFGGTGVVTDHIIYCHLPRCESLTTTSTTTTTKATAPVGKNAKYVVNPDYKSKYYIVVFAGDSQSVAIYRKDSAGKYSILEKCFTCSTGAKSSPTRTGQYKIWRRFEWRLLVGNVYGQYSTSISSDYLFHSVPYFKASPSTLDIKEYDKLGSPASHGCIRLCVRDSKWIYDNCPNGTQVNIVNASGPKGAGVPKRNTNSRYNGWDPSDPNASNPYNKYPTTTTTKATTATTKTTTTTKKTTTSTTTTTTKPTTTATTAPVTMYMDAYAAKVLELVNAERAAEGLEPLKQGTSAMEAAARLRAKETVDSFSHTRPNGSSWSTSLDEQGQYYLRAGENIAKGYNSPEAVVNAWMNSEGHRANIMNPDFTHLSVGCYSRNGYLYWVQLFCTLFDTTDADLDSFPDRVLELVNEERAKEGLSPLEKGPTALETAAQVRADETTELFSHTRPDGSKCFTAITEQGLFYMAAGENIARGYTSPEAVVEAWMNSEGHRENIMDEDFSHLSVGCAKDEQGRICWVQLFALL